MNSDTIFALSSGPPPAAIAVVRISGPRAGVALERLIGRSIKPRQAALATVRDPRTGERIDQALALWFPGPNSETGEDTAELQLHGGRAVIAATLRTLGSLEGLRMAEPGEFTRRALANGRLDLTAVEGLADLIGAETEVQRAQALRQLQGGLADRTEGWRQRLIGLQARVEADLDFSDEGDIPQNLMRQVADEASKLAAEISVALATSERGERIRGGFTIALAGPVNAGKSSLFNWLAGRDAAIVSPYPGTTRDVLEVHLDLGGFAVAVLDTAGVRETEDPVEQEGVRRAQARAGEANLVLWVEDVSAPSSGLPSRRPGQQRWLIWNKSDLIDSGPQQLLSRAERAFRTSIRTGAGLDSLLEALRAHVMAELGATEPAVVTRQRQRQMLDAAHAALLRAGEGGAEELVAEELRLAAHALGRLVGRIDVEDVLDVIFREFCIGK